MPVVTLRTLPLPPDVALPSLLSRLAEAVGPALGADPRRVFAVHQALGTFMEGDVQAERHLPTTHPPLVDIAAFAGRTDSQIEQALQAAAAIVTEALALQPGNAFVTYSEIGRGRVFTGGSVRH
jgi:hypothetical protein